MSRKKDAPSKLATRSLLAADARGDFPGLPTTPDWVQRPADWVPPAVVSAVRALYADASGNSDYINVLKRLVTDPRMQRVWVELQKQTRGPKRTLRYPAKTTWDLDDPTAQHDRALASLLYLAVNLAMDAPRVMTQRQVKVLSRKALDKAKAVFADGEDVAAREYRAKAANLRAAAASSKLIVKRDTGDAQARCFAIMFAHQCRELFGLSLYGVTARVASVALGRTFDVREIREWVAPPKKKSKSGSVQLPVKPVG
jgi:hypothetical protein